MFYSPTCEWCEAWDTDIGPIYAKTAEGHVAPLRRVNIDDRRPVELNVLYPVVYTPTFVLMDNGHEAGRIVGYPGEDHFWGLLRALLARLPSGRTGFRPLDEHVVNEREGRRMRKLTAVLTITLAFALPAVAEEALMTFKVMTPETALALAQAALADCRKRGFQVAVAVVDRAGVVQVVLRDRFAGAHTPDTARRKAYTAVSFRTDTLTMAEQTQAGKVQSGARQITDALMIGGGVPVEAAGSLVGAVGISGAPGGDQDDACARAGIQAIISKLSF